MTNTFCSGYRRDSDGDRYCPLGYTPHDEHTWRDMCDACQCGYQVHQETLAEMAREEA